MEMKRCGKALLFGLGVSTVLFFSSSSTFASSEGGHGSEAEPAKATTVNNTIKAAVAGNDQFKSHHNHNYFETYQKGQSPSLTVITCADSRVHTSLFGMDPNNNIFIIRNIGNQIKTSEGSVDYGVHHLPTKILLVMGHSSCGAVKAAMGDYSGETRGIKAELDSLRPLMTIDNEEHNFNRQWATNVEINVDYQVQNAIGLYRELLEAQQLAIVGAVYDFNDHYGKGRGTLVITNVNGITDPNKIMNHPVLNELSKSEVVSHISSLAPTGK